MKYFCFFAALAVVHAQGQVSRLEDGKPDLGGDGVWLPIQAKDLAMKNDVPFQAWAKLKFQENNAMKQNHIGSALPASRRSANHDDVPPYRDRTDANPNPIYV